jgi:hypothetical protein
VEPLQDGADLVPRQHDGQVQGPLGANDVTRDSLLFVGVEGSRPRGEHTREIQPPSSGREDCTQSDTVRAALFTAGAGLR